MPTYEYACTSCGEHLEVVQSFRDDALTTCPACGGEGTLEGDDGSDMSYEYDYGDGEYDLGSAWAKITVPADYFSCSTCHLILGGYELIEQANLPGTFEVIDDDPQLPEPEYGND